MDLKSSSPVTRAIDLADLTRAADVGQLKELLGLVARPRYRGPTPIRAPRAHPARWAEHDRGHMAKAFRNYAVRYMTKDAIRVKRADLGREARVAVRSGDTPLAEYLTSKSGTYPW